MTIWMRKYWNQWRIIYRIPGREESSLIELAVIATALDDFIVGVDPDRMLLRETFDDREVEEQFVRLYFGIKKGFNYKYRNGIKTWLIKKD